MRPVNSWDLRSYKKKPGEPLRDFIRHFSKQRTELSNVTDFDVITAFLSGTTCKDLVRELTRSNVWPAPTGPATGCPRVCVRLRERPAVRDCELRWLPRGWSVL